MGDNSNIIDFDFNENYFVVSNNNYGVLNVNADNGFLTTRLPVVNTSPLVDKDMMTGVNNNNEEYFSTDIKVTMTKSIKAFNTSNQTLLSGTSNSEVKNEIFKTSTENSLPEFETSVETIPNDSFSRTVNLSPESNVKNVLCSPLKTEIADISPVNTSKCSCDISTELHAPDNQNGVNNCSVKSLLESTQKNSYSNLDITEASGNPINPFCILTSSKNVVNNFPVESGNVDHTCKVLENSIENVVIEFSNADSILEVPKNTSNNNTEFFSSADLVLNESENSTDELNRECSNEGMESKISVCPRNKLDGEFFNSKFKVPENSVNKPTGDLSSFDTSSIVPKYPVYKSAEDFSSTTSTVFEIPMTKSFGDFYDVASAIYENPGMKPVGDFSVCDTVSQVPENPVNKLTESISTVDAPTIVSGMTLYESARDLSIVDKASSVHENPGMEPIEDFSDGTGFQVLENPVNHGGDIFNVNSVSKLPENPINKPNGDFFTVDAPSIVLENPTCESTGDFFVGTASQVLENSTSKVPENPVNKPNGDFSVNRESQLPRSPFEKPPGDFSNACVEFNVPEILLNEETCDIYGASSSSSENPVDNESVCTSNVDLMNKDSITNAMGQFLNEDFACKVSEDCCVNPVEQFEVDFGFKIPNNPVINECDEEFMDAVQFFKDPSSFHFLESIKTSVQPESMIPRSSLYVKFDPLLSKFSPNMFKPDDCASNFAALNEIQREVSIVKSSSDPKAVNRHLSGVNMRELTSNVLISFDSPKPSVCKDSKTPIASSPKLYTEDDFQQKLKILELTTQEVYLKKQREMESQIIKHDNILKIQKVAIEELLGILTENFYEFKMAQGKVELYETENKKLKEDLKTSAEDLQSVENTFADFHKRYEQCKGMLKTYKENEEHLKQVISDFQTKVKEHEQMYSMLQERSEEMLEKASSEVVSVKRAGEAQMTVLKAQLKKAEMKISSLESDIKQIKIENSQLGGICDDLMAKVSRP
ncbi:transforming acidic coiled-coil-containing protein 3 [Nephila pilipes]|uniref:Transforming acidic coiled-coil-containing protein 3 n=1 Tax=Nephila pilipes TaxID=299642 RepID=A0A8X6P256_NEPPI|nr:transforming acidic coiled-coil-containing protein 3 [Nephila pilipes]